MKSKDYNKIILIYKTMRTINGVFISFILGGAIGSAIALLYAPKSGKHLRNDISKKTNALIKEGKKITAESWDSAKEKAENAIDSANDFLSSGADKIMRNTEKVRDALRSGVNAYNNEKNEKQYK